MGESNLARELSEIMEETDEWSKLFESFCYKSKFLIERQRTLLQRLNEENVNLKVENTSIKAKNRRLKQIFHNFGCRFREYEKAHGMLPGTMSPGIAVNGHHLVGSEDEMESMASPPILNPPTPGSPVFPGLVQLSTQDVNTTPEKPKRMHENTLDALMRNSLINSPSKGRSPIRRRSTPKKRIPPQSPNGKKFKQLKMDVFSPAKQNVEEPKSPFKIPQSPYGRKFVKFYTCIFF